MGSLTPAQLMQALIDMVAPVIAMIFSTVGDVIDEIVSSPYLMFTTGFLVVGGCIKIVRSLLRK